MSKNQKEAGIEDLVRKIDSFKESGKGIDDFFNSLGQDENTKEKLLKTVVEKLVMPEHLLEFSRLDREMSYYVCKHLLILNFFHDFYMMSEYRIAIIRSKVYPFYEKKVTFRLPPKKVMMGIYRKFVNELLQLTIAYEGQGRQELVSLFRSLNQQLTEDEKKSGFLQKFGLSR